MPVCDISVPESPDSKLTYDVVVLSKPVVFRRFHLLDRLVSVDEKPRAVGRQTPGQNEASFAVENWKPLFRGKSHDRVAISQQQTRHSPILTSPAWSRC